MSESRAKAREHLARNTAFCPAPFEELHRGVADLWRPCCHAARGYDPPPASGPVAAWESPGAKRLRAEMWSGRRGTDLVAATCRTCFDSEARLGESTRLELLDELTARPEDTLLERAADATLGIPSPAPDAPESVRSLVLKVFGNHCNFRCLTCNGVASSAIAREEGDPARVPALWSDPEGRRRLEADLRRLGPTLRTLKIKGGEPFVSPGIEDLLDFLVEAGVAETLRIKFHSNMSLPSRRFDALAARFERFGEVVILASVDQVGARAEYVRYGTDFESLLRNLRRLVGHPRVTLQLAPTISAFNIGYLDELLELGSDLGVPVVLSNLLTHPFIFRAWNLPDPLKARYRPAIAESSLLTAEDRARFLRILDTPATPLAFTGLMAYLRDKDKLRGNHLPGVFPEMAAYYDAPSPRLVDALRQRMPQSLVRQLARRLDANL